MPVYRQKDHGLCPHCYWALIEDTMTQTSGLNPDFNIKRKPAKKKKR